MKSLLRLLLLSPLFSFIIVFAAHGQDILSRLNKDLDAFSKNAPKERVLILTDRDVYAPGDIIWLYATVYDLFSPVVSKSSSGLNVMILNGENTQVLKKTFSMIEGRVKQCFRLPTGLQGGVYYLRGETDLSKGANFLYRKILIKTKIVPPFAIEAEFKDAEFIPGDDFSMKLTFKDFYSEPMRNVLYSIDFFDGESRIPGPEGKLKKEGLAQINVKVPLKLKTGIFSFKVTANVKGKEATLEGKFPVLSKNIFLDFYPENGMLINGIASRVHVFSYDAAGEPLAVEADLLGNGNIIKTFLTDSDGLGTLELVPDIENSYSIQLKRPLLLDQVYTLPEIRSKGIVLRAIEKSPVSVKYKLINGYNNPRDVYLAGIANNQIFHVSEHQVEREFTVEVPLDNVNSNLVHFMVLNAAMRIEGEHILAHSYPNKVPLKMEEIEVSEEARGKVHYQVDASEIGKGDLVFSAVNDPWISQALGNQTLNALEMPFDSERQMVFQSGHFHKSTLTDENWDKYTPYYVPAVFGWDRILDTKGAFEPKMSNALVNQNLAFNDQLLGKNRVEYVDGVIRQSNLAADDYFATSNPLYITKLYQQKVKKTPAYKTLLQNGTPVLEVIQSIKPYDLQGTNIVFFGTNNSINFQGGALIVIDGINRGTDATVLSTLSPYDVDEISASTNPNDILRYTGLNSVGVIEIKLKTGRKEEEEDEKASQELTDEFQSPKYDKRSQMAGEDYRSTLYWTVIAVNDDASDENVIYYNSDLISGVKGNVYFIPDEGAPRQAEVEYTIK